MTNFQFCTSSERSTIFTVMTIPTTMFAERSFRRVPPRRHLHTFLSTKNREEWIVMPRACGPGEKFFCGSCSRSSCQSSSGWFIVLVKTQKSTANWRFFASCKLLGVIFHVCLDVVMLLLLHLKCLSHHLNGVTRDGPSFERRLSNFEAVLFVFVCNKLLFFAHSEVRALIWTHSNP